MKPFLLTLLSLFATCALLAEPRLSVSGRYLLEDGKPFFWMGNTAWLIQKLDSAETETYLSALEREGYNVIQVQTISDTIPWRQHDWDHMDQIVRIAARHHIYVGMVPIWGGLVKQGRLSVEEARAYGQFLAERYGPQWNIVWFIGGDQPGSVMPEVWMALAESIKAIDTVHLMSYHPRGRTLSASWWNHAPWIDFHSFQSGHRRYGQIKEGEKPSDGEFLTPYSYEDSWHYVERSFAMNDKPVLDAEPSYEHIPQGLHDPSEPLWEAPEVRRYAWWSVLSGAMGHTYGHNAQMSFYDPEREEGPGPYGCTQSWQSSLSDDGFLEMRHLKDLFLALVTPDNLPTLRPDTELLVDQGDHHQHIAVLRAKDFALVYDYTSRPFTLDLSQLPPNSLITALWYSPSTGAMQLIPLVKPVLTTFSPLLGEGDGNDCVLLLKY